MTALWLLVCATAQASPEVDALAAAAQRGMPPDVVVSAAQGLPPLTADDVVELLRAGVVDETIARIAQGHPSEDERAAALAAGPLVLATRPPKPRETYSATDWADDPSDPAELDFSLDRSTRTPFDRDDERPEPSLRLRRTSTGLLVTGSAAAVASVVSFVAARSLFAGETFTTADSLQRAETAMIWTDAGYILGSVAVPLLVGGVVTFTIGNAGRHSSDE